jgi:hypothetical protein
MSDSWQDYSFCSTIATKLVRNDHPRSAATGLQQLAKETDSSEAISFGLHQDVDHHAMLINCTPQIMLDAIDLQEHFIQEPLVRPASAAAASVWPHRTRQTYRTNDG